MPNFNEDGFDINHKLNFVGSGLFVDGLFKLNCKVPFVSMNTVGIKRRISTNETSSKLWHKRLGHISKERMQTLTKTKIFPPLDYHDMDVCVKEKMINTKKKGAIRSQNQLEHIHTNICGLFPTPTHDGFKYFITFIDDYSRYGYIYLLAKKSAAF